MSPLALSIRFLQTQPDQRLVALAGAGHERAFEALVQRYRRPLLRYCRRLVISDVAAEDILQQALLQAWIALNDGRSEVRDARAWLYRIVHNVAISHMRRVVEHPVEMPGSSGSDSADDALEQRLAVREALESLASLPEPQRQVMLGTAVEGRSHEEVAAALGLSHGAVRGLIYRARAAMRAAAAGLVPAPLIEWAAQQEVVSGRSAAVLEALAGGGSAGISGAVLKGGALIAAGALATAAGINVGKHGHSSHGRHGIVAARKAVRAPARSVTLVADVQRATAQRFDAVARHVTLVHRVGAARHGRALHPVRTRSWGRTGRRAGTGTSERGTSYLSSGGHDHGSGGERHRSSGTPVYTRSQPAASAPSSPSRPGHGDENNHGGPGPGGGDSQGGDSQGGDGPGPGGRGGPGGPPGAGPGHAASGRGSGSGDGAGGNQGTPSPDSSGHHGEGGGDAPSGSSSGSGSGPAAQTTSATTMSPGPAGPGDN